MDDVPRSEGKILNELACIRQKDTPRVKVNEIYLDGKLRKAECIDEDQKSYGIFMHSLILSNYAEVMRVSNNQVNVIGDEFEKAIFQYTASKGFSKELIDSIAPKLDELDVERESVRDIQMSAHLINDKVRIVSKGTPDELLERCSYILDDSKFVKITRRIFREVNSVLLDMLNRCLLVYAIAIKDISKISEFLKKETYVRDMALVALVGMGRA